MEKWFIWDEIPTEIFIDEIGNTTFNKAIEIGMERWKALSAADQRRRISYQVCYASFVDSEPDFDTIEQCFVIK